MIFDFPKLIFSLIFLFLSTVSIGQVFINEWMASNSSTIADEFNEYDDWFELYNAGSSPINLNGYYFSDNPNNPTKFQIEEDLLLDANGYLLLWADDDVDQGINHLGFKLSSAGELISISSPQEILLDSIAFSNQFTDVSMGRFEDGGSDIFFFSTASPGSENEMPEETVIVQDPVFSVSGGFSSEAISVELITETEDAQIHFTLDGSAPNSNSPLYTEAIQVEETSILRAIATKEGLLNSPIKSQSYFIEQTYSLPVVSIITDPNNLFGPTGIYDNPEEEGSEWERFTQVQYFKNENLEFTIDCGIRIQGGSSVVLPKKSFRLFFDSEYGEKWLEYPLFEGNEVSRFRNLVLRSGYDDSFTQFEGTLLREPLGDKLFAESGGFVSHSEWAVLTINGEFWGIYEIRESINDHFIESHKGWEEDEYDLIRFKREGPELKAGSFEQWNALESFLENNDLTDSANYAQAEAMIDVEDLINLMAFVNNSSYLSWTWGVSTFKEKTPEGKWQFIIWDLDRIFNFIQFRSINSYTSVDSVYWPNFITSGLLENEIFRNRMLNRTADLQNTSYKLENALVSMNAIRDEISAEVPMEIERWAPNFTFENWENLVFFEFYDYFNQRPAVFQAEALSVFNLNNTNEIQLNIEGEGFLHLNTIDIPETPWSGTYFEGVPVTVTATAAPGYIFSHWSDPNLPNNRTVEVDFVGNYNLTAHFILGSTETADIVINEINYNSPSDFNSGDWVELYNNSSSEVDLSAWTFREESGDYFNIPEGTRLAANEFLVIAEDSIDFLNVFPNVENVIGNFAGFKLNNDGEYIELTNADASFIDSLRYADNDPWPTEPDGEGPTLQLIDPNLDNSFAESWTSLSPTPGQPNFSLLEISCPDSIVLNAPIGANSIAVNWDEPVLLSDCTFGNVQVVQFQGLENGADFPIGISGVAYQAIDSCGNISTCNFSINIEQEELVSSISCPENLAFNILEEEEGLVVNWPDPVALTNCEINTSTLLQTSGLESGSFFPVGNTLIEYSFDSGCEETLTCSFTIDVSVDSTVTSQTVLAIDKAILFYPNPADEVLNIEFKSRKVISSFAFYNILGTKIFEQTVDPSALTHVVSLRNFNEGIYLVSFQRPDGSVMNKQLIIAR